MTQARIEYTCDWHSDLGDDQRGHINVTTPTGKIEATWSCTGGMGDGADLISNTTKELTDDEAAELINSADLCQGNGTYDATIETDDFGWFTLSDVKWVTSV